MKDTFDMPDMDALARQMEDAMAEAKKALDDLPMQMGEMEDVMGSLSALMGGMPAQMEELNTAMAGFGEQHAANVESMVGEPDWSLQATIRVGQKLHVVVDAAFDLENVVAAWNSTQDPDFEALVGGVVADAGEDVDAGMMGQIMGQLKKGRSVAHVEDIDVVACRIQGAPANAAETLQLSPEGNIPLVMDEGGLGFEFAPLMTIRNRWERANIPTFTPMSAEIVVPLSHFEDGEPFSLSFQPTGQDDEVMVELSFQPL